MKKIKNFYCYLVRILKWFIKPIYLHLLWVIPLAVLLLAISALEELGQALVLSGLILQILGVTLTISGLFGMRRYFEKAGLLDLLKVWLLEFPKYKQSVNIQASSLEMRSSVSKVSFKSSTTTRGNNNLLERVNLLEERLNAESLRVTELKESMDQHNNQLESQIEDSKRLIEEENNNLSKKIEESSTRGIWEEAVGLSWILLGLVLTTVGSELGKEVTPLINIVL